MHAQSPTRWHVSPARGVNVYVVVQEQYGVAAKMRNQAIEQLKALETWVERQATGLDMAANPESLRHSFDKLLKVWRLAHSCSCFRNAPARDEQQVMSRMHMHTVLHAAMWQHAGDKWFLLSCSVIACTTRMVYNACHFMTGQVLRSMCIQLMLLWLQVMDSLYQARVKKNETDLLIDQLKETLHYLTVQNKVGDLRICNKGSSCSCIMLQCCTQRGMLQDLGGVLACLLPVNTAPEVAQALLPVVCRPTCTRLIRSSLKLLLAGRRSRRELSRYSNKRLCCCTHACTHFNEHGCFTDQ